MLGDLLRRRRRELGLSLREAARRIDISPAYLSSLEHGRNPSTGRPPVPSPPVLGAIGRVLGIDLETLLGLAGAGGAPRSAHVLLVQLGAAGLPTVDAARVAVPAEVGEWLELSEPLGLVPGRRRYDAAQALQALAAHVLATAPNAGAGLGLIVGAAARPLAQVADPAGVLAAEATWEDDVARTLLAQLGRAPAANVCVYREADIRAVRNADPLAVALALVRAHPHVAAQRDDGGVETGTAAIEAFLSALRPADVSQAAWTAVAAATARGLGPWTPSR